MLTADRSPWTTGGICVWTGKTILDGRERIIEKMAHTVFKALAQGKKLRGNRKNAQFPGIVVKPMRLTISRRSFSEAFFLFSNK